MGERVARLVHAFDGRVSHVVLGIRSLDSYWASVIGFSVARGVPVPGPDRLDRLVTQPRSWRDVVTDVACAAPGTRLSVLPFESFVGRADAELAAMTEGRVIPPAAHAADSRNETPDRAALQAILHDRGRGETLPDGPARWQPFDTLQAAALRETHLDDLFWLRAGADGLATLTEDPVPQGAGTNLPGHPMTRGQENDRQERGLVQTR